MITSYLRFRLYEKTSPKRFDMVWGTADGLLDMAKFDERFDDSAERASADRLRE